MHRRRLDRPAREPVVQRGFSLQIDRFRPVTSSSAMRVDNFEEMKRLPALPRYVSPAELRKACDRVGELGGWDFSSVNDWRSPVPWQYEDVVIQWALDRPRTLDIGTGGGEVIERIVPMLGPTVLVDRQHHMASAAQERLSRSASVVIADGRALPFPDATFDLVLDRHAPVFLAEFTRVLVPGGMLITQQVGGRNLQSIFDAFGWGANADQWGEVWSRTQRLDALVSTAPAVGLEVLRGDDYEVEYALTDLDSLVFTLKHVPFPEPFEPDAHAEAVNRLLRDSTGPQGVMSSEHRQLFVARKGQVANGANALE
jgi:SAM-dependent methyltransferase